MKTIKFNEIKPGDTYITSYGDRIITKKETVKENGKNWVKIYWDKIERNDYGTDCGYAGIEHSDSNTHEINIR